MEGFKRRYEDTIEDQQEIEKMIAEENNPQLRLQLMVMNRINLSLIANTRTINDVRVEFNEHLLRYDRHAKQVEAVMNQSKGAKLAIGFGWKLVVGLIVVINTLVGVISANVVSRMVKVEDAVQLNALQHQEMFDRMKSYESKAR